MALIEPKLMKEAYRAIDRILTANPQLAKINPEQEKRMIAELCINDGLGEGKVKQMVNHYVITGRMERIK